MLERFPCHYIVSKELQTFLKCSSLHTGLHSAWFTRWSLLVLILGVCAGICSPALTIANPKDMQPCVSQDRGLEHPTYVNLLPLNFPRWKKKKEWVDSDSWMSFLIKPPEFLPGENETSTQRYPHSSWWMRSRLSMEWHSYGAIKSVQLPDDRA